MKKIIIFLFILQFVFFNSSKILSDEQYNGDILHVYVNGLVCDFCARSIEKIFSKQKSVAGIKVNLKNMLITINLKEKTFVVYTDGVTEGYLKNGQELGAEGVQRIVTELNNITPKNIVDSIATELNWGAEKLRDDITCLALDLKNTELVKSKKKNKEENKTDG